MDYVVGSVAALISGNVTPNRPKHLKRASTPVKHQLSPDVTPKSEQVEDRSIFLSPTLQKKKAVAKKSPKRIFESFDGPFEEKEKSLNSPQADKVKKHLEENLELYDMKVKTPNHQKSPKKKGNNAVESLQKKAILQDLAAKNNLQIENENTPKKKKKQNLHTNADRTPKTNGVAQATTPVAPATPGQQKKRRLNENQTPVKANNVQNGSPSPQKQNKPNAQTSQKLVTASGAGNNAITPTGNKKKRRNRKKNKKGQLNGSQEKVPELVKVDAPKLQNQVNSQVQTAKQQKQAPKAQEQAPKALVTKNKKGKPLVNPNAITDKDSDSEHESDDDLDSEDEDIDDLGSEEEDDSLEEADDSLEGLDDESLEGLDDDDDGDEEDDDEEDDDEEDEEEEDEDDSSDEEEAQKPVQKKAQKEKTPKEKPPQTPESIAAENLRTVFVGNAPFHANLKNAMKKIFIQHGPIESVRIRTIPVKDASITPKVAIAKNELHPDRSTVNVYVKFFSPESAKKALVENNTVYKGNHIRVTVCDNTDIDHDPAKSIFVGNLPFTLEDEPLREKFEKCGKIESVRIIRDSKSNAGKGFGFINFASKDSVELALALKDEDLTFKNRIMRVKRCSPNPGPKKGPSVHYPKINKEIPHISNVKAAEFRIKRNIQTIADTPPNKKFKPNQQSQQNNRQKQQPPKDKKQKKEFVGMTAEKKKQKPNKFNKNKKQKKALSEILTK